MRPVSHSAAHRRKNLKHVIYEEVFGVQVKTLMGLRGLHDALSLFQKPIPKDLSFNPFSTGSMSHRILHPLHVTVNPRKLEHGFRRILARIPYTLP